MDSIVSSLVGLVFGSLGAFVIWIYKKRRVPYKKIWAEYSTLNDVVGIIIVLLVVCIIYSDEISNYLE